MKMAMLLRMARGCTLGGLIAACSSDVGGPAAEQATSTTGEIADANTSATDGSTGASATSSSATATGSNVTATGSNVTATGSNATATSSSSAGGTGGSVGTITGGVGGTTSTTGTSSGGASTTDSETGADGSTTGQTTTGSAGSSSSGSGLGSGVMVGSGSTTEQYETALVSRDDKPYVFITNGWGPGFQSHSISWEGTSFVIESMSGNSGANGEPASYPTVFCGRYSVMQVPDCGLPESRDAITSLRTGWRWAPNGNEGEYNAAYDIWVGNGTQLQGYLMVWLRDPPSYQPAGSPNPMHQRIAVENVPGEWDIWDGTVNRLPIINWVRAEGSDSHEIEFDVLDFVRDAQARGLDVPGTHINAVAVGFEIWEGPVSGLETVDFYVDVE